MRPYGIKANKRKEREPKYDREEDEEEKQPKFEQKQKKAEESVKKAKMESSAKAEEEDNEEKDITEEAATATADDIVGGIPIVLSDRSTNKPGVVFVLEKASLEVAKVGKVICKKCFCYTLSHWFCLWY